jgi:hypothetical protein
MLVVTDCHHGKTVDPPAQASGPAEVLTHVEREPVLRRG